MRKGAKSKRVRGIISTGRGRCNAEGRVPRKREREEKGQKSREHSSEVLKQQLRVTPERD